MKLVFNSIISFPRSSSGILFILIFMNREVYCGDCREVLGWKYERAYEASQKYKEGKFILEKSKIVKENW